MKHPFIHLPAFAKAAADLLGIAVLVLSTSLSLFGQDFHATDKFAQNTPPGKTTSIKSLAEYLCAEMPDDAHKARSVYTWITQNIEYVDSTDGRERYATPEYLERQRPQRVLQNRTAVCQGYANLFCALMTEAGLPCEVVSGLVKNADDEIAKIGHAWAVARISGEWRLFDPTWGVPPKGAKVKEEFFMANPAEFVLRHLPDDPMWQLLENPLTEHKFRVSFDDEILAFVSDTTPGGFKFRDTLRQWIAMDSLTRIFASESRVLRFNGSNERVLLALAQRYWGLFFDLRNTLDSLVDAAILADTVKIDTVWFMAQIYQMDGCHARARQLIGSLETPERIEKSERFYTQKDVFALLHKLLGDMRTGLFEHLHNSIRDSIVDIKHIAQLRYQIDLAKRSYIEAENNMDCSKMAYNCFEIYHNRSLMDIQLGRQQILFAQGLANDQKASKNLQTIVLNLNEARSLLNQAIADCDIMRSKPTKFAFIEERRSTAQQWLVNLRICEIRAERTALSPDLDKVFSAQKISLPLAKSFAEKMPPIARSIARLEDTIKLICPDLGDEFVQIAQFNLQVENFALQFNHANLLYRIALNEYDNAIAKNKYRKQRVHIRSDADLSLQTVKKAVLAMDYLKNSGRLTAASIRQKQLQVNKLSKAISVFLSRL